MLLERILGGCSPVRHGPAFDVNGLFAGDVAHRNVGRLACIAHSGKRPDLGFKLAVELPGL